MDTEDRILLSSTFAKPTPIGGPPVSPWHQSDTSASSVVESLNDLLDLYIARSEIRNFDKSSVDINNNEEFKIDQNNAFNERPLITDNHEIPSMRDQCKSGSSLIHNINCKESFEVINCEFDMQSFPAGKDQCICGQSSGACMGKNHDISSNNFEHEMEYEEDDYSIIDDGGDTENVKFETPCKKFIGNYVLSVNISSDDDMTDKKRFTSFFEFDSEIESDFLVYSPNLKIQELPNVPLVPLLPPPMCNYKNDQSVDMNELPKLQNCMENLAENKNRSFEQHAIQGNSIDSFSDCPPPYSELDILQRERENMEYIRSIQEEKITVDLPVRNNKENFDQINSISDSISQCSSEDLYIEPDNLINSVETNVLHSQSNVESLNNEQIQNSETIQLAKFLPTYRSLIHPNRRYNYKTRQFEEVGNSDFKMTSNGNQPVVTLHKKKKENKLMSILMTTNNNIKQKIIEAASDTLSTCSHSVSVKSHSNNKSMSSFNSDMTFNKLPDNIKQKILKMLIFDQKALVNCLYVNKNFETMTLPILYYYPKFTSTYRVGQFVTTILNNSKLADFVKILNFSNIDYPLELSNEEKQKYHYQLIFGTMTRSDIFGSDQRPILAGWRDWKYRHHSLYGMPTVKRMRTGSTSTSSSATLTVRWGSDVLDASYSTLGGRCGSSSSITLVNNSIRSRSFSASGSGYGSGSDSLFKMNYSLSRSVSISSNKIKTERKGIMGSIKKAFGISSTTKKANAKTKTKKMKRHQVEQNRNKSSSKNLSNIKQNLNEMDDIEKDDDDISINYRQPFTTSHPRQNHFLNQYTFNKDLPAGYILHLIKSCKNVKELSLDGITISSDFEILNYDTFDWGTGMGKLISAGKPLKEFSNFIFWSDTNREMDIFEDDFTRNNVKCLEIGSIWKGLMNVENIERLSLSQLNSLNQTIVEGFVMKSKFNKKLKELNCSGSGMVKRDEWGRLKTGKEWRCYFRSHEPIT